MNRSLAPLTRKSRLGPAEVSFPLTLRSEASASALVPAPRRAVTALLGTSRLRPVPLAPRQGGLLLRYTRWTESPVGPFAEVTVFGLAYLGIGSPVPGLAPLVHTLFDRSTVVGDYGLVPVCSLVDTDDAAAFLGALWHVPAHVAPIRSGGSGRTAAVQVEHHGDPLVRLSVRRHRGTATTTDDVTVPLFGHHDGVSWCDVGAATIERPTRRFRAAGGHVALYGLGPLAELAFTLGATSSGGFDRRAVATSVCRGGRVRWAGPRPLDPDAREPIDLVDRHGHRAPSAGQ